MNGRQGYVELLIHQIDNANGHRSFKLTEAGNAIAMCWAGSERIARRWAAENGHTTDWCDGCCACGCDGCCDRSYCKGNPHV
jgi:hypothetical protein